MKTSPSLATAALLFTLVHCGGGTKSTPAPPAPVQAKALAYTEPATGTYLLKKNTTLSTPASHLVLELWGPATASGSGVTATFTVDATKATWANVAATDAAGTLVANGTVFGLGTGAQILKAKATGDTLIATVSEKGVATAKALNGPLLRIALNLSPSSTLLTGTAIPLAADAAKCQVLLADGTLSTVTVATGTLVAQ